MRDWLCICCLTRFYSFLIDNYFFSLYSLFWKYLNTLKPWQFFLPGTENQSGSCYDNNLQFNSSDRSLQSKLLSHLVSAGTHWRLFTHCHSLGLQPVDHGNLYNNLHVYILLLVSIWCWYLQVHCHSLEYRVTGIYLNTATHLSTG